MTNEKLVISLHESAKKISKEILQKESELILLLQQIITHRVYQKYGYPNLFKYLVYGLGISESRAYDYSVVARSSLKFKKLELALKEGKLSISKARRIAPVLDETNQDQWIEKAKKNTHRNLEKLVAGENPDVSTAESSRYVSANSIEVKITLTEEEFREFKRVQDVLCQKEKKPVSMKQTLVAVAKAYREKNDPVTKALKNQRRKTGTCQKSRPTRYIPADVFHQIQIRDEGKCQETMPNGHKCEETKWVDLHHIKPLSQGGTHSVENLVTLCKGHHQMEH